MYTDEEYHKFLQNPTWTRKQTDRLFELCSRFDLRFITIHDHFTNPGPTDLTGQKYLDAEEKEFSENDHMGDIVISVNKTVEDLKQRFYTIQKSLLTARNSSDPDLLRLPVFTQQFDHLYESERKHQLERLFTRSKEQVTKMAQLVLENRNLTLSIKALKRKKGLKGRKSELATIPDHCIAKQTQQKQRPPGITLRSTELANSLAVSGRHSTKQLETEIANLGIKKGRPFAVPTQKVGKAYDKLQCDIVTYINLQKHVTKQESERDTLKATARAYAKKNQKSNHKRSHDDSKDSGVKRQKRDSHR